MADDIRTADQIPTEVPTRPVANLGAGAVSPSMASPVADNGPSRSRQGGSSGRAEQQRLLAGCPSCGSWRMADHRRRIGLAGIAKARRALGEGLPVGRPVRGKSAPSQSSSRAAA